ncbi:unnamed protein product [Vitrella brassicaformis CCMP3155]|uniref:Uncharacterized protein n=1 Tax=Vitrella brassicaformis (strain CCMP3155) TaxID=1169540 RepID=A0A0G4GD92_VITBC|nr:unnamed protein product [Vitrella brassicaformis CCMP3155]|mmetsp:Transcript_54029/g.135851  ORF Transcript_54029/g.135851 Transcript_54029/m.135851 type:complete len:138 (-) Transcript_54029:297-710(-)|eukprot:CEM27230.1 unnamed protein product [Vitrella brassicaformis CCMP3155]
MTASSSSSRLLQSAGRHVDSILQATEATLSLASQHDASQAAELDRAMEGFFAAANGLSKLLHQQIDAIGTPRHIHRNNYCDRLTVETQRTRQSRGDNGVDGNENGDQDGGMPGRGSKRKAIGDVQDEPQVKKERIGR